MAKTAVLLEADPLDGLVADDPVVVAARAAVDGAVAARDRTAADARALRTILASPPSAGDGLSILRARVGLPAAEVAEVEASLGYEEAAAACARVEAEVRAQRVPGARERIQARLRALYVQIDAAARANAALCDTLAAENAAMGRQMFPPGDFLWPELLLDSGADPLLALRRTLLQRAGWLD